MSWRTIDYHGGRRAEPGDLLAYANVVHRVLSVREVNSRQWPDRWRLETEKVGRPQPPDADWSGWADESIRRFGTCAVHRISHYEPGTRPGQAGFEPCGWSKCEGCGTQEERELHEALADG